MARFISFYKAIPPGTPSRDRDKYRVAFWQIDHSVPKHNKPMAEGLLESAIRQFEEEQNVTNWRQVAEKYEIFEIDYD